MKKFVFRVNEETEMDLLDKCMDALKTKKIPFTASYTVNDKNQNVIIVSTVNMAG
ncbi:hypothetical protein phiOC_p087 [Ochrobactrum phage vB_OspM_OC]|nr:hypothetical protein phiOC_p087 [Ochrobactrum phage vB_OspM_OC]